MDSLLSIEILPNSTEWEVYSNIINNSTLPNNITDGIYSFISYVTAKIAWGEEGADYPINTETLPDGKMRTTISLNFKNIKILEPGAKTPVNFKVLNGPLLSTDDLKNLIALPKHRG